MKHICFHTFRRPVCLVRWKLRHFVQCFTDNNVVFTFFPGCWWSFLNWIISWKLKFALTSEFGLYSGVGEVFIFVFHQQDIASDRRLVENQLIFPLFLRESGDVAAIRGWESTNFIHTCSSTLYCFFFFSNTVQLLSRHGFWQVTEV